MFKLWPYIFRSTLRNKVRATLTLLGMAVAVAVFCCLASIESSMHKAIDGVAQNTLMVVNEKDQW